MTVNHNNIEEFLLDYLEGNLDPVHTAELMAFLAENPEYEELIRNTRRYAMTSSGDLFPDAHSLKKNYNDIPEINSRNFDEFCIAATEGLLDPSDIERLNRYIGEDSLKIKNLELFNTLKLKPDLSIQFPDKDKLKKTKGLYIPRRYFYYSLAIAASVVAVLFITLNKPNKGSTEPPARMLSNNSVSEPSDNMASKEITEPSLPVVKTSSHSQYNNPAKQEIIQSSGDKALEPNNRTGSDYAINLTLLEPKVARIHSDLNNNVVTIEDLYSEKTVRGAKPEHRLQVQSENLFAGLLQKINFWKTAESAISGFNYLTEANISIDKITDDQGRLTRLTLNTESYSIQGKLR